MNLTEEFERIRLETGGHQWMTKFSINGSSFGGFNSYKTDPRIKDFLEWTYRPALAHILELGSCEGGQSFELIQSPYVQSVYGLDGKDWLVKRATEVAKLLNVNASFGLCDFDNEEHLKFLSNAKATSIFCSGVLYHLAEPWKLLKSLIGVSDQFYLATHFTNDSDTVRNGYQGATCEEPLERGAWSGLTNMAFWFNLPSLIRCLLDVGWNISLMRVWNRWSEVDHRPMVSILCNRS